MKKRIAAVICTAAMVLSQAVFVVPAVAYAEEGSGVAGEVLSVRVQYAAENWPAWDHQYTDSPMLRM